MCWDRNIGHAEHLTSCDVCWTSGVGLGGWVGITFMEIGNEFGWPLCQNWQRFERPVIQTWRQTDERKSASSWNRNSQKGSHFNFWRIHFETSLSKLPSQWPVIGPPRCLWYWLGYSINIVLRDHPKSLLEISDEQLRENLLARLIDAKLMGPGLQVGFNHDPEGLPERKLPHGNFATLYIMYESFCKASGEEPASRTVFYQVGKRWKVCLRFHKPSVHSKCWTCSTLKARIANAIEPCMLFVFMIWPHLGDQIQCSKVL